MYVTRSEPEFDGNELMLVGPTVQDLSTIGWENSIVSYACGIAPPEILEYSMGPHDDES